MSLGWVGFLLMVALVLVVASSLIAWLTIGGMLRSARARDERLEVLHGEVEQLMRALSDPSRPEAAAPPSRRSRRCRRERRRTWWQKFLGFGG